MNIILLGATGSIGSMTLELIRDYEYNLLGVSLGYDLDKSLEIVKEFKPKYICVRKIEDKAVFSNLCDNIYVGEDGLNELAKINADILVNALSGSVGLMPTITSIKAKNDIALANKESLVMAGDIIMKMAKDLNVKIYPVDSEHNAIWQAIKGEDVSKINRIYITASGGAFRDKKRSELENVTVSEALNHPNWKMGKKITIDSATMMNKGLEVIEAHHLFNIGYDKITPILHKESVIHALVEYSDSNIKAILAPHDMKAPILYALNRGNREYYGSKLDLSTLHFKKMSFKRFPCLKYSIDAGIKGGIMPTVLTSANETAVNLFLDGKIKFLDIEKIVYNELKNTKNFNPTIEDIIRVDKGIRSKIMGGRL